MTLRHVMGPAVLGFFLLQATHARAGAPHASMPMIGAMALDPGYVPSNGLSAKVFEASIKFGELVFSHGSSADYAAKRERLRDALKHLDPKETHNFVASTVEFIRERSGAPNDGGTSRKYYALLDAIVPNLEQREIRFGAPPKAGTVAKALDASGRLPKAAREKVIADLHPWIDEVSAAQRPK